MVSLPQVPIGLGAGTITFDAGDEQQAFVGRLDA